VTDRPFNLAIETSGRAGSVTLGRGDELIATAALPPPAPPPRRSVDLMPTIDALCRAHGVGPAQVGEVYVSIGPGSFTGLRIAVATAKVLAPTLGVKLVSVPTLDVVAQNVPTDIDADHVAVCLNLKRNSVYAGVFGREPARDAAVLGATGGLPASARGASSTDHTGGQAASGTPMWVLVSEPALMSMADLLQTAPRPLALVGDPLPPIPEGLAEGVLVLDRRLAAPRSEAVWRLGRAAARRGDFADPFALVPLYVRPPEAVELWNKRHGPV
jgi:tRNA threonylcarbamoyladenosine biosynthesis protein TsaB